MAQQIPFDKYLGKAFKVATPPADKVTDMRGRPLVATPDTYSIVTPENGDAWNWPEARPEHIQHAKLQWKQFNNSKMSRYKKNQILRSISKLENNK